MPKATLPDEYPALLNDLERCIRQSQRGNHHTTNNITSRYPSQTNEPRKIFQRYRLGVRR